MTDKVDSTRRVDDLESLMRHYNFKNEETGNTDNKSALGVPERVNCVSLRLLRSLTMFRLFLNQALRRARVESPTCRMSFTVIILCNSSMVFRALDNAQNNAFWDEVSAAASTFWTTSRKIWICSYDSFNSPFKRVSITDGGCLSPARTRSPLGLCRAR